MVFKLKHTKEKGQSIPELFLLLALISVVSIMALTQFGASLNTTTNEVNNALNSVNTGINTTT
jgi:Flp pilus assembly pilin Flp